MLALLLSACLAPVDTAADLVYTGEAWRPVVAGWIDGNAKCGTMDGPCYDCVETSTNWYVRWEYDVDAPAGEEWHVYNHGVYKEVTAGDGSCTALTLGAPLP